MLPRNYLFIFFLCCIATASLGQKLIKGIVVDSTSLTNLPGVNVKIKNTNRGTSTNSSGIFTLMVTESDTLVFSSVGYAKVVLPVYLDDETMFVRMREESILLREVIIKDLGFRINQKYVKSPTLTTTKPLKAGSTGGVGVNFAYFTKLEKEKRKLVRIMADNEKVKIYLDVVNDPDVKAEILNRFAISEDRFYELLAVFNEKNKEITYSANSALILNSLFSFYENATIKK
jgi:CarboxypepD_reg-like domain